MTRGLLFIRNIIAKLLFYLRKKKWLTLICTKWMPIGISKIMAKHTNGKGIFIYVLRFIQQGFTKVAGSYIMNHISKKLAAKRIISYVRENGTSVNKGMRFFYFFIR